ncbi:hypothetical protein ACWDTT_10530 [Streptosporangium sandarakinum]
MTASYPGAIRTWSTKLGWRHIVWASHVNDLQTEIDATQRTLGLTPQISRNNPGGLVRDYTTVDERMTAHARGEAVPYFRAQAMNYSPPPGVWAEVPMTTPASIKADPFSLATSAGVRLNSTGLWMIEARTEWQATGYTGANKAARRMRILINGADVGLTHYTDEDARNSFALHNAVTWLEPLAAGTQITVQVMTGVEPPPTPTEPTKPNPGQVWTCPGARWRLIRCWNGERWEHYTGSRDTAISSPTAPSGPRKGRLWIDTSSATAEPKVYTGSAWEPFTGLEDLATDLDAATPPAAPTEGQVWVDSAALADITRTWWDKKWQPVYARNCRDGHGQPVPTPPPTTPTTPNYGLKAHIALRVHQLRCLDHVPPTGAIRSARDAFHAA